jgi:hypothetical protein
MEEGWTDLDLATRGGGCLVDPATGGGRWTEMGALVSMLHLHVMLHLRVMPEEGDGPSR